MRLFDFRHRLDWGHDFNFGFLKTRRYSLLQISISWSEYAGWPYLQLQFGNGKLFGILFWAYKFGFDLDFIGNTWYYYKKK